MWGWRCFAILSFSSLSHLLVCCSCCCIYDKANIHTYIFACFVCFVFRSKRFTKKNSPLCRTCFLVKHIIIYSMGSMLPLILFVVFMWLMRTRRFPVIVARVWFVLCTVLVVAIEFVICFTLRNAAEKKWISKRRSERICCFSSGILMGKVLWFLSPQIHVKFMEGSLDWRGIENRGVFCACHTSFFDTIFFLWLCPVEYLLNVRSFAKRALWKMPLMGEVIRACGHLPVHFTAGGPSFAVDKEKQAVVSAAAESFLADGGVLCFFPEGALNPTPEVLTDFRLGTFSMVVKHQVPIHYIVYAGCSEVWDPALKGMPGFPADVYVYVGKYEYDENATAVDVAKGLREEMQRHLDDMLARRKKEQYVPFYKKSTARN